MNGYEGIYCFYLYDDYVVDQKIDPITDVESHQIVGYRNTNLLQDTVPSGFQFVG